MRFAASVVLGGKNATGIEVPAEVVQALGAGRQRVPVTVTIGSYSYRTTIAPVGGSSWIPLAAEHREAAGLAANDSVEVDLERDDVPRSVEVPADLAVALAAAPGAQAAFDALSSSDQRRHVLSVEGAKTDETRTRRVSRAVTDLTGRR